MIDRVRSAHPVKEAIRFVEPSYDEVLWRDVSVTDMREFVHLEQAVRKASK
jgi:hypothetical protein